MSLNLLYWFSMLKHIIKIFIMTILCMSLITVLIDISNIAVYGESYYRIFICFSSVILTLYYLFKNQLDQSLTFVIIGILFNPIYTINLERNIWTVIEFPIVVLYCHRLYYLFFEEEFKQIERIADKLDLYFKELERTISSMSYHQVAIYLQKRYTEHVQINSDKITWIVNELPDIQFEILSDFYSLGKESKGGVNAKFLHQFKNVEAHLNFNLTAPVKYTIKEGRGLHLPNRPARYIKRCLVRKYHYLDL